MLRRLLRSKLATLGLPSRVLDDHGRDAVPVRDLVPRDQPRQRVERHLRQAVQREFVHLVERHVHQPREQPSTIRLPPTSPPIMLPTVLNSPSDTSEPKSR